MNDTVLVTGGTVQAGGGLYIERRADTELLEACSRGDFSYVLTSRQMGKSSLMVRAAERLQQSGSMPVFVDLTELGMTVSADQWYKGILVSVEEQLGIGPSAATWWDEQGHLSIAQRFLRFFQEVVLARVTGRIVIFVDEIDSTLPLPFTDDFFTGIRFCYNARAVQGELRRLSFVLSGVTTPGALIKDPHRTPFNIGRRIELTDFSIDDLSHLADMLPVGGDMARAALTRVYGWTGGHPYLTMSLVRSLVDAPPDEWVSGVDDRVAQLFLGEGGERDSNIQFVSDMLTRSAPHKEATLRLYRDVRRGHRVIANDIDQTLAWLELSGVVVEQAGVIRVRNRVYEHAFDVGWVNRHLPLYVDWTRQLTRAARALLAFSVLPLAMLAGFSVTQWKDAERARAQAELARDEAIVAGEQVKRELAEQRTLLTTLENVIVEIEQYDPALAEALRTDANAMSEQLKERERIQEMASAQNVALSSDVQSLRSQLDASNDQADRLQREVASLQSRVKASEASVEELTDELVRSREQASRAEDEQRKVASENDVLRERIARLEKDRVTTGPDIFPEDAVQTLARQFGAAVRAADVDALTKLWPTIPRWRLESYQASRVDCDGGLQADFRVDDGKGQATSIGYYVFPVYYDWKCETQRVGPVTRLTSQLWTIRRVDGSWQIVSIEER